MRGDTDDMGLVRELSEFFGTQLDVQPQATFATVQDDVVVRSNEETVAVEANLFKSIWIDSFWADPIVPADWNGEINEQGIRALAAAASRLGQEPIASKLRRLVGPANIMQGSSVWSANSIKRKPPAKPVKNEVSASNASLTNEVLAYFERG